MLEHMSRRSRSLLSLTLTTLALALSILALCTSYWCEGTHKVVKPLCLSPVKMKNCGQNNSEPYTTESPTQNPFNRTLSPARREELAKIRQRQLANAVHYIWETGEDKFAFRYFHTGFWESCEKHSDGVLWLSVISEFTYIGLLGMGFLLMWLEVLCSHKEMHSLKINAYAAICTVLSVLPGCLLAAAWGLPWSLSTPIQRLSLSSVANRDCVWRKQELPLMPHPTMRWFQVAGSTLSVVSCSAPAA
ncbi:hypothetical protein PAMA_015267 [Pampus argenteus]